MKMAVNGKCRILAVIVWAMLVASSSACESVDTWSMFPHLSSYLHYKDGLVKDFEKLLQKVSEKPCCCTEETTTETGGLPTEPAEAECREPMDCAAIYRPNGTTPSGVYQIWPRNRAINGSVDVYCDMDDDGGGWTVIQRRGDFGNPFDYFYRNWSSYKDGFGNLTEEFWIGNNIIHALTTQSDSRIKFDLGDWEGYTAVANYDDFYVEDELQNYLMQVSGYSGTAGDSFSYQNNGCFTTKDRKNDRMRRNCADEFKGAWWYTTCHRTNLNALYLRGNHTTYANGVNWDGWRGLFYSLKDTVMKVRPKHFGAVHVETTTDGYTETTPYAVP